ncbi:WD40 repeat-like protein [Annulohypoxylon maeteangense]|uniref:WD40 repeat-like protein n=1 Tax=Annulohypoxylon maeteangense TaxID=1927788 RepID=UPI002008B5AA|nr:WD40 repeat-like protein [Annulohypoxylon maeteangense]KAI0886262.1 WD40 repeat-like protein [Annulohypoxylon maeteangense]
MNTRPVIESPPEHAALSVTFNSDASRFVVGLDSGFCIFLSNSSQIQTARVFNAGLGLVQMMGNANYLALVGGGRSPKFPQNKVIVWDDSKGKIALELATLTAVRGVQISKSRIAVVLQNCVRVYAFQKPPLPLARYETADNFLGLCCLTEKYLVFPGRTPGQVQVVQLATDSVSIIPAHSSSLRALQLSADGELLATASEKGTIIRIFSTSSCAKLAERRRGSEFATIYSLRFSPSGNMLACTSDKGSLHIFDVPNPRKGRPSSPAPSIGGGSSNAEATNKWGFLSNIPFGPFSDVYSFTSAAFETGEEPLLPSPARAVERGDNTVLGTSRPMKGVIGWIDETSLAVVGAGQDARWEKFVLREEEGRTVVVREGWKRYLGN